MDIERVLVVYKRSFLSIVTRKLTRRQLAPLERSHRDNEQCMETVQSVLRDYGIAHDVRHRSNLEKTRKVDLVISVGGDGTFLSAATHVVDKPILGVNSSPSHSVGFFCGAKRQTFERVLQRALDDDVKVTQIARMRVTLDGEILHNRILNDVLMTQDHPAATSRYIIQAGRRKEDQRSSGIWIATPAGSTAAIRAAGGKILPIKSTKLQFIVREPYLPPGATYRLARGIIERPGKLTIESKMVRGRLYLDGPRHAKPFEIGMRVAFEMRGDPLSVIALDHTRRKHWR